MIERLAERMVLLKREFAGTYAGDGNARELVPDGGFFGGAGGGGKKAKLLNLFAEKNPMYYGSYRQEISGTDCTVHEGDTNEYWLGSIAHKSSLAPFSPTWIASAYLLALESRAMGFKEVVDVGSGDGRIAYCGAALGLVAHSVEIDPELVELQRTVAGETGVDFGPRCADAAGYDWGDLNLERPVFCIGGLSQMGGDVLADGIIKSVKTDERLAGGAGFVLAGTHSKKYAGSEHDAGWGRVIKDGGLDKIRTVLLPTAWTFKEPVETPYVFARL